MTYLSFTFGPDIFANLKNVGVQIKEKITVKTAIGFGPFGKNTGPKKPVVNLALFMFVMNI